MTTYAADDLKRILELHRKWYYGEEGGTRADLTGADLTDADLTGAVLTRADLTRADLTRADLTRADLTDADLTDAVLSDGVTWGEYLSDVVPALLTAGGKPLEEVATEDVWACHSWNNCPMHAAFDANGLSEIPALHRWQASRFVQLFDAKLIPLPQVAKAAPAGQ
jgi:hypothetical protein